MVTINRYRRHSDADSERLARRLFGGSEEEAEESRTKLDTSAAKVSHVSGTPQTIKNKGGGYAQYDIFRVSTQSRSPGPLGLRWKDDLQKHNVTF